MLSLINYLYHEIKILRSYLTDSKKLLNLDSEYTSTYSCFKKKYFIPWCLLRFSSEIYLHKTLKITSVIKLTPHNYDTASLQHCTNSFLVAGYVLTWSYTWCLPAPPSLTNHHHSYQPLHVIDCTVWCW